MNDWIDNFNKFKEISTLFILKRVYCENLTTEKKLLWFLSIILIPVAVVNSFYLNNYIILVAFAVLAFCWGKTLEKCKQITFSKYYYDVTTKKKMSFHFKDYTYLKYLLLKEEFSRKKNISHAFIEKLIKYTDIEVSTYNKNPASNNVFLSLGLALLSGSILHAIGKLTIHNITTVIVVLLVFIVATSGPKIFTHIKYKKLNEFKRFLQWYTLEIRKNDA